MFSTLSNFLPSALHSSPHKADEIRPDDDDDDDNKSDANPDDTGVLKKKKDKSPNETFIFVRPPPAKTNHPLNLQVQLIPPNSRGPSGLANASRQSLDLSSTSAATSVPSSPSNEGYEDGAPLSRTSSTASSTHSRSSSASTYSAASTSSSASSRRMIVPLYNLQAHNVMTNTIVDAGTDAKIAKFSKRGIEMLELAVLEPVEVYAGGGAPVGPDAPAGSAFSNKTIGARPSMNLQVPAGNGSRPVTPDPTNSSQASLTSSSAQSHGSNDQPPSPGGPHSTPQKKGVFGKLFKRKEDKEAAGMLTPPAKILGHSRSRSGLSEGTPATAPTAVPPRTSISSIQRSSIDLGSPDLHQTPTQASTATATAGHGPILGVVPSVSAPTHPPKGRPGLYVWVVKRWLKGDGGGLLSVAKGMVKGHQEGHDVAHEVEVRFEWKRGKSKGKKNKKHGEPSESGHAAPRRQGSTTNMSTGSKRHSLNVSVISRQSSFSGVSVSEEGVVDNAATTSKAARRRSLALSTKEDAESGDESDPEDSETPWSCTVKVRRLAGAGHARSRSHLSFHSHSREPTTSVEEADVSGGGKKEVLKIKVGTLSPTPHHPKVVAMLKVPFPLPDVNVEGMKAEKRDAAGPGGSLQGPARGPAHTLVLTAEEIKDVVCSTGLWLVVREGFGGVGKVSRKGDGWRIRG
ncbi:hypothetical protein HMN09_00201300 [Mycena chlorophos]|uniref:Uncharacterized protein n=1 Tax=Mycena chlorophos TaxID=658473 RepID=A0A8H6TQV2_MYCCL|nr:hypothetical protein HMN09_00201300 [Mycena chlorophos]